MKYLKYITAFLPLVVEVVQRVEKILDNLEADNVTNRATATKQINNAPVSNK